jgi:predicted nucleic acid-binding protein
VATVFLDATCWVAAAGNPNGGSAEILKLARAGDFRLVTTAAVLIEAERNILKKMTAEAMSRFLAEMADPAFTLVAAASPDEEARWTDLVAEKDAHVLAGTLKAGADVLVTLDRKHILTDAVRDGFPIRVSDTREFLEDWKRGGIQSSGKDRNTVLTGLRDPTPLASRSSRCPVPQ